MDCVEIISDKGKLKEEYIRSVGCSELKQIKKIKLIIRRMNLEYYLHTRRKSHLERINALEEVCERKINDNAGKMIMQAERNKIRKYSTGETYGNFGRIKVGNTI